MIPAEVVLTVAERIQSTGVTFGALGLIMAAVAMAWRWPVGPSCRWLRRTKRRMDHLLGTDDEDGCPGLPGAMRLLQDHMGDFEALTRRVRKMETELHSVRARVAFLFEAGGHSDRLAPEDERG